MFLEQTGWFWDLANKIASSMGLEAKDVIFFGAIILVIIMVLYLVEVLVQLYLEKI